MLQFISHENVSYGNKSGEFTLSSLITFHVTCCNKKYELINIIVFWNPHIILIKLIMHKFFGAIWSTNSSLYGNSLIIPTQNCHHNDIM